MSLIATIFIYHGDKITISPTDRFNDILNKFTNIQQFCMRHAISIPRLNVIEKSSGIYRLKDVNMSSLMNLSRPINTLVMSSMLDIESDYTCELRHNKSLVEYVSNLNKISATPADNYVHEVNRLSNGIINVEVIIEELKDIVQRPFTFYKEPVIELPNIHDKLCLSDALTLLLSRDRHELPTDLNKYAKDLDELGFIQEGKYIEGIFNQLLLHIPSNSEFHVMLYVISECIFNKSLSRETLLDLFVDINKRSNIFYNLKPNEIEPLANYIVDSVEVKIEQAKES